MARIRTIKPDFFASPKSARVTRDARLFFAGLLTEADDEGRLLCSSKRLAGCLFPYDEDVDAAIVEAWLAQLQAANLIHIYTHEDVRYALVNGFTEHQKVSHPTASKLPAPTPGTTSRNAPENFVKPPENFVGERKGRERKGKELAPAPAPKERKPDELWDAVMDACGVNTGELTGSARGGHNKAVAELRAINANPQDVAARARNYRRTYPNASLTPTALAKHWASLANAPGPAPGQPAAGLPRPLTDEEIARLEGTA